MTGTRFFEYARPTAFNAHSHGAGEVKRGGEGEGLVVEALGDVN
jgi:hypothetical protein